MQKNDGEKFKEMLAIISETYSTFKITPPKIKIWWAVFKSYELKDFEAAIFSHITDENKGTFEPKPADILRFMPEPNQLLIESKGSLEWCDNTRNLLDKYHPLNGSFKKGLSYAEI